MCGLSLKADSPFHVRQHFCCSNSCDVPAKKVLGPRVRHQACRRIIVCSSLDKRDLSATSFFCRGSQKTHPPWLCRGFEGIDSTNEGTESGGGDEVMPASMAYSGEGIILGVEYNKAATGTKVGRE
jgi:hypothetical protein